MALREIFAHFSFDFDKASLDRVNRATEGVKKHAKEAAGHEGIGGVVEGLKGALTGFVASELVRGFGEIAETADQFQDLSEQIGISTGKLQALQYAAKINGADVNDLAIGLKKLSIALAGGSADSASTLEMFKRLGVETKDAAGNTKTLEDLIPSIADGFAGLKSQTERAALATQLFGRSGSKMAFLLAQGAPGLEKFRQEFEALGGGFSPEALEAASKYNDAVDRIQFAFRGLASQLLIHVAPQLEELLNGFAHGVAAFGSWLHETTALQTALGGLAAFLSGKLLAALAPFLIPGLKFLAIFLAVDDLIAFLRGQDSVIGAILNSWFGEDFTNDVRDTFNSIGTIVKGTLGGIYDLWKALTADSGTETDRWLSKFESDTEGMSAALDNFANQAAAVWLKVAGEFYTMVAGLETAWNNFVNSLKLPPGIADKIKVGPEAIVGNTDRIVANALALSGVRSNIENNKDKIAGVQTPSAIVSGPVRAPQVSTNYVELNAPVTVTLPPGVTPVQARALAREAQKGGADAYRSAVQSLEQRVEAP